MAGSSVATKGDEMIAGTIRDLTPRQQQLLKMMEHGGVSRFIAMVNSGDISKEDAKRVAAAFGKERSDKSNLSALSRFARLVLAK